MSRLVWGCDDPLKALGLSKKPDLVLASDVVYGNDPEKWGLLVKTMRDLSGPHTLLIVGNVQRYPVHHPMAETRFFHESTAFDFERSEIPVRRLHPEFQKTGGGSCVVHVFLRKRETDGEASRVCNDAKREREVELDGGAKAKKAKRRKE